MKSTQQRAYLQDFAIFHNLQTAGSLADYTELYAASGESNGEPQVQGDTMRWVQQGGNVGVPALS